MTLTGSIRPRNLLITLEGCGDGTLVQQVMRAIRGAILEGRLESGMALPGIRSLCETLDVSRNTVVAALCDLVDEGWLVTEPNRGTFVASPLPEALSRAEASIGLDGEPTAGFDLPSILQQMSSFHREAMDLSDGYPDPRLAPIEPMAKAYQRGMRLHGERLLKDGEPMGNEILREAIAGWVSERYGRKVSPECVLVTSGNRMALSLISRAFLASGDRVMVENPGEKEVWDILRQNTGAEICPVPLDSQGACVEAMESQLQTGPFRFLFLSPRRQHPTTRCMGPERERALLELAVKHRVAVLEDDGDALYHYGKNPALPLWALDRTGQVILIGSFSRLIAPGCRLGFLLAPEKLVTWLAKVRKKLENQGDPVLEWAVADLIRDGELGRHLNRSRRVYEERRDLMVEMLRKTFGDLLEVQVPDGGLSLWLRCREGEKLAPWLAAAKGCGLLLRGPDHYYLDSVEPCFRLGFAQLDEKDSLEAVRRLSLAWKRAGKV